MLRKYTFQLTQYAYTCNSRNFNGNISNMWSPGNVLINRDAYKIEFLNFIYWITIGQYVEFRDNLGMFKKYHKFLFGGVEL